MCVYTVEVQVQVQVHLNSSAKIREPESKLCMRCVHNELASEKSILYIH